MNSHWLYNNEIINEIPEGMFGFVYRITNLESGKMYIGRKYAISVRRKALTKVQKAAGTKYIMKRKIKLNNPAGWDEYDKYSVGELINMGYDGVILPDDGRTDYLVFNPESIK